MTVAGRALTRVRVNAKYDGASNDRPCESRSGQIVADSTGLAIRKIKVRNDQINVAEQNFEHVTETLLSQVLFCPIPSE